jgi:hypothetical protein
VGFWSKEEGRADERDERMGQMELVSGVESGIGHGRTTRSKDGCRTVSGTPVGACQFSMANGTESDMSRDYRAW